MFENIKRGKTMKLRTLCASYLFSSWNLKNLVFSLQMYQKVHVWFWPKLPIIFICQIKHWNRPKNCFSISFPPLLTMKQLWWRCVVFCRQKCSVPQNTSFIFSKPYPTCKPRVCTSRRRKFLGRGLYVQIKHIWHHGPQQAPMRSCPAGVGSTPPTLTLGNFFSSGWKTKPLPQLFVCLFV